MVARIQAGVEPDDPADDVKVLCYVSVGEDLRTAGLTTISSRADPRFRGDGTGPRVDPARARTPTASRWPAIDPRGAPVDRRHRVRVVLPRRQRRARQRRARRRRRCPIATRSSAALFVNAGDPAWFDVVDGMKLDGPDGAGRAARGADRRLRAGLACDGVFLDTIDTAAPNAFTDASSPNQSEFEWTAPGLRGLHPPGARALPGQADPAEPRPVLLRSAACRSSRSTPRGAIDFVLFESYRLDSNDGRAWDPASLPRQPVQRRAQADGRGQPPRRVQRALARLRRGPARPDVARHAARPVDAGARLAARGHPRDRSSWPASATT